MFDQPYARIAGPAASAQVSCSCGASAHFEGITSSGVRLEVQAFYDAHVVCRQKAAATPPTE